MFVGREGGRLARAPGSGFRMQSECGAGTGRNGALEAEDQEQAEAP